MKIFGCLVNQMTEASIPKGFFKYTTDCKKTFPADQLIYSAHKMAASKNLSPQYHGVTIEIIK
jgi:hypothetical protein